MSTPLATYALRPRRTVHPFPARMAPAIALEAAEALPPRSLVLDPMAGSGTVLRAAARSGHDAVGFDTDPLAVLMAQVTTSNLTTSEIETAALEVRRGAESSNPSKISLPWIDNDRETSDYINYWFGAQQQGDLRRLVHSLPDGDSAISRALKVAVSRTIVTKDRGASLARDVSHSRPHKTVKYSDYDVLEGFTRASRSIARVLDGQQFAGSVKISRGDARDLHQLPTGSIQAAITSPPYLNAIDYIRGHRLSLVWLGHQVGQLRSLRARSIGSERAPDSGCDTGLLATLRSVTESGAGLPHRIAKILDRYLLDMHSVFSELSRVLDRDAPATIVIGNSTIRGVYLDNATTLSRIAEMAGFRFVKRFERELPPSHRYLPPPRDADGRLNKRMRTEVILTFAAPS